MYQPARLPENFDQISPEHLCSGIWFQNTPSPQKLKFLPESKSGLTQNTPPHRKWKTLTFFPEFRSELTQNIPPWKWKTLTFFPEFRSEITQNTDPPPPPPPPKMKNSNFLSCVQIWAYPASPHWRLKYVETVSPKDTISFYQCSKMLFSLPLYITNVFLKSVWQVSHSKLSIFSLLYIILLSSSFFVK